MALSPSLFYQRGDMVTIFTYRGTKHFLVEAVRAFPCMDLLRSFELWVGVRWALNAKLESGEPSS
jgi:hypothetical protein